MSDSFFKRIESKTGVSMDEVFALANAIQYANFNDERQVRQIIQRVSDLAGKEVTPEMENHLVDSIVHSGKSFDFSDIEDML